MNSKTILVGYEGELREHFDKLIESGEWQPMTHEETSPAEQLRKILGDKAMALGQVFLFHVEEDKNEIQDLLLTSIYVHVRDKSACREFAKKATVGYICYNCFHPVEVDCDMPEEEILCDKCKQLQEQGVSA